ETSTDNCIQEGFPPRTRCAFITFGFRLLKRIVDGDWKRRMRLLREASHRLCHAIEKESLCVIFATVAVWCGDQLLGLWHSKCGEDLGEHRLQRASQPN